MFPRMLGSVPPWANLRLPPWATSALPPWGDLRSPQDGTMRQRVAFGLPETQVLRLRSNAFRTICAFPSCPWFANKAFLLTHRNGTSVAYLWNPWRECNERDIRRE